MGLARGLLFALLIFAIAGVVLIAIALGTDNWKCFRVDTASAIVNVPDAQRDNEIYFSRSYGFFRECFEGDDKPRRISNRGAEYDPRLEPSLELWESPHGTDCVTMYPEFKQTPNMSLRTKEYVNMKIAYITLYAIGLFIAVLALIAMLIAIGLKKGIPVVITGFFFFIAAIFLAAGIGVWQKSNDELSQLSNFRADNDDSGRNWYSRSYWSERVANNTVENFCWSYYIAWIGIGLIFLTSIISCCITCVVSKERTKRRKTKLEQQYGLRLPVYGGTVGLAGSQTQIYATPGSEKAVLPSHGQYEHLGTTGSSNYGYVQQAHYPQQQYNYYDYMGYYNPFGTLRQ